MYMRIGENATDRYFHYSFDGETYFPALSESKTAYTTPDQVVLFLDISTVAAVAMKCLSWS